MDKTNMAAALERAGLMPRVQPVDAPRFGERSAVEFVDPKIMADKDIVDECATLRVHCADIKRQLDDDKEEGIKRGEVWRANARRALRAKNFRLDQLTEEARKRGLIAALPEIAAKAAIKQIDIAAQQANAGVKAARSEAFLEKQAQIAAQKAERQRVADARNKTQCEMFVKAAYQLHSRDVCDRIWRRAKEMFAGDPAWLKDIDDTLLTRQSKTTS